MGKSTLVKAIAKRFKAKVFKFAGPKAAEKRLAYVEQYNVFYKSFDDAVTELAKGKNVVFDRSYVGEAVYYDLLHRLKPKYIYALADKFNVIKPYYVILAGKPVSKPESDLDQLLLSYHNKIQSRFFQFIRRYGKYYMVIDHKDFDTLDSRNEAILSHLKTVIYGG